MFPQKALSFNPVHFIPSVQDGVPKLIILDDVKLDWKGVKGESFLKEYRTLVLSVTLLTWTDNYYNQAGFWSQTGNVWNPLKSCTYWISKCQSKGKKTCYFMPIKLFKWWYYNLHALRFILYKTKIFISEFKGDLFFIEMFYTNIFLLQNKKSIMLLNRHKLTNFQ